MKIKDMNTEDNVKRREQIKVQVFQPWSNFVCKIKLPDEIFVDLQKLYDESSKLNRSFGSQLVGQIENEPEVTPELQSKFSDFTDFCLQCVEQFVRNSMHQNNVGDNNVEKIHEISKEKILTRIATMWFVDQKPGEYNPVHIHTNCKVSSVMYLKKPSRQIKDRKEHYNADGMITFINNTGTDINFSNSQCSFSPEAGDMYIFPALQHHMVWPYRSDDPNDSRISLSFNADFTTESNLKREQKNHEMMYEEMKKMKESENDKSINDGNINKSG